MKAGPGAVPFPAHILFEQVKPEVRTKTIEWLSIIQVECERLGLPVSSETAKEVIARLSSEQKADWQWLSDQLQGLQRLIRKEIKSKAFFYIPPEKTRFWPNANTPYGFTEPVSVAFPSTNFDSAEAGVCLATARATACVFHLMRVLEIGLGVLGGVFSVSLAHTNWAPAIEQIESKIRDMHKDPTWKALPDCREQQEFYAQAASHFGILKDAWRNYTAHARGVYTEERATLIFENTKAFMETLATRLHE
jgi:hypothetical protein